MVVAALVVDDNEFNEMESVHANIMVAHSSRSIFFMSLCASMHLQVLLSVSIVNEERILFRN
jgi:hypothetical protein